LQQLVPTCISARKTRSGTRTCVAPSYCPMNTKIIPWYFCSPTAPAEYQLHDQVVLFYLSRGSHHQSDEGKSCITLFTWVPVQLGGPVPCFRKHCSPERVVPEFTVCQIGTIVDSTNVVEDLISLLACPELLINQRSKHA
jgi:hypothetical protein